ncbi:MAG TPA: DUF433 domain-containing protein [Thermoanaerobaculia bacterium]
MIGTEEITVESLKTRYEHVILQDSVPVIAGTTMKVTQLVAETMAYGWSPEELHFQHPHLSMGQIHSALAYYWDHTRELDQEIQRNLDLGDQIRESSGPSPLRSRLKAKGLL